jgi:transposase
LYDNKKETFEVKSDPVEFEMKIKPYLKKFKQSDMLIIMEHTGVYHLKLANYLYENNYQVAVINPFSIKKFMEAKMTRVKADKADSFFIAEYGRTFFNGELYKPKPDVEKEIEVKLKILEDLQQQLTMLRNQRESLTYGNFERFKSVKDASSFIGISPGIHESAACVKKSGSIKKMGNPYARKILYMAALSAIRFNKYCRELYERLINKGKAKKLALVAIAHKLLRQAYGVLKSRRPFDENFCT